MSISSSRFKDRDYVLIKLVPSSVPFRQQVINNSLKSRYANSCLCDCLIGKDIDDTYQIPNGVKTANK